MANSGSKSRVYRGRKTQEIAAEYMQPVWPEATAVGAFLKGVDIKNTPGWRVEVKGTRDGSLTAALKQADGHEGDGTPVVIWRPDRYGPERVGQWIVAMRLENFRNLVTELTILYNNGLGPGSGQ